MVWSRKHNSKTMTAAQFQSMWAQDNQTCVIAGEGLYQWHAQKDGKTSSGSTQGKRVIHFGFWRRFNMRQKIQGMLVQWKVPLLSMRCTSTSSSLSSKRFTSVSNLVTRQTHNPGLGLCSHSVTYRYSHVDLLMSYSKYDTQQLRVQDHIANWDPDHLEWFSELP